MRILLGYCCRLLSVPRKNKRTLLFSKLIGGLEAHSRSSSSVATDFPKEAPSSTHNHHHQTDLEKTFFFLEENNICLTVK